MGKPTICIGKNKDADQLRGNREADQRLCFRYSDSTIPPLLNSKLYRPVCVRPVRKPHCWFFHEVAHIKHEKFYNLEPGLIQTRMYRQTVQVSTRICFLCEN